MSFLKYVVFLFFLFTLLVVSAQTQDKQLSDAKTMEDVIAFIDQEMSKAPQNPPQKETFLMATSVFMSASEKLLEIAGNDSERWNALSLKLQAFQYQKAAEVEGAEKKLETFLNELSASERPLLRKFSASYRFGNFYDRMMETRVPLQNLDQTKFELKTWLNQKDIPVSDILSYIKSLGGDIVRRYDAVGTQIIEELLDYAQSPACTLTAEEKTNVSLSLESVLRLATGRDPKLYGKTLDDKDFKWESLRGKYVLVKFTATWCLPCKRELPGMREVYKKYHDKGFEIVSVYIRERGKETEQVEIVKKTVKDEKLPWLIISEALTDKAKQPKQGTFYSINGVPTMVLVDKDGKVVATDVRCINGTLQAKLAEIFK